MLKNDSMNVSSLYLEDIPIDMILRQFGVDSYNAHSSIPAISYSQRNSFVVVVVFDDE